MADEADARVVVREGAGEGEQAGQTGVIEPRLFTELDLAFPLGGKNLRRLLGASGAGMNQPVGHHAAGGQRRGDPPGVGAAAIGQPALVVVAPDGRFSLGVANEKQPAHERRLLKPARIGKRRRTDRVFYPPHVRHGGADDVGRFSPLGLAPLPQEFLKRRLGVRRHIRGCKLCNRPGLQQFYVRGA